CRSSATCPAMVLLGTAPPARPHIRPHPPSPSAVVAIPSRGPSPAAPRSLRCRPRRFRRLRCRPRRFRRHRPSLKLLRRPSPHRPRAPDPPPPPPPPRRQPPPIDDDEDVIPPWDRRPLIIAIVAGIVLVLIGVLSTFASASYFKEGPVKTTWHPGGGGVAR